MSVCNGCLEQHCAALSPVLLQVPPCYQVPLAALEWAIDVEQLMGGGSLYAAAWRAVKDFSYAHVKDASW